MVLLNILSVPERVLRYLKSTALAISAHAESRAAAQAAEGICRGGLPPRISRIATLWAVTDRPTENTPGSKLTWDDKLLSRPDMACTVCHRESPLVVWEENGYEGRQCECGTVYTSPEPPPGSIEPRRDSHPDAFYSRYAMAKARWVHRIQPPGRLLEIGCGEGHFLRAARSLGYRVAGVEPDPDRARRVRDRLGIEVRCSFLEELEWQDASFDVVYHCDLLSHFADPLHALHKMSGLLAPGGILAFEAGTLGGIHPFWYRWVGQLGMPQHRWLYSEKSLRRLVANAGLQILKMQHFGLAPAVALHQAHVSAARLIGSVRRRFSGRERNFGSSELFPRSEIARADAVYDIFEQFFRYGIGSIAPRVGPATWFIAAQPM
jgi:SAM-dependent methyltransferase